MEPAVLNRPIPREVIETGQRFETFAPVALKIQTEEGDLVPFAFNPIQVILGKIYQDIINNGRLLRVWILKARREGITTETTGRFYYLTTHNRNRYAYHITHEPEATEFVFNMVKRYYNHAPLRPQTKYNNKKILEFNTDDGRGLDSAIRVGTAGKDDLGSGQLIHLLHLSELAKWPASKTKALLTSLMQCVPADPGTYVIGESTAKGIGGEFYEGYWSARYQYEVFLNKGKPDFRCRVNPDANVNNEFSAIFIPWFVFPKYQRDPEPGFVRTEAERLLVRLYGINDCHLQFRRWTIQNKCGGDPKVFQQEYPSNAEEAFIASGRPVFDAMAVLAKKRALEDAQRKADTRKFYTCALSTGQWISATPDNGDTDGILVVYEEPKAGMSYVVSADVAEGLEKGDFDAVHVVEQLSGREVAAWHGHMAPDLFGILVYYVGQRYNIAWVAPERNNHGLVTVTKLLDMNYPNIYVETIVEPPAKPRKRYGWYTGKNKTAQAGLIDTLVAEFRERPENFLDPDTLGEMLTFKHDADGSMNAEEGKFDDRVMSRAIGNYVRRKLSLPSAQPATPVAGGVGGSSSNSGPSMGGYT